MPRLTLSGTPSRTNQYVYPRGKLKLFALSLAAGLGVAGLLTLGVLTGVQTAASPGPVATSHASFEQKCAACHAPRVADVRCESCHDPFGSNRFQNSGHVWFGKNDRAVAAKAAAVDCARCHADHRGREFVMVRVDDRRCASCHFRSLPGHPEFALVKAGAMKGEGLLFDHKTHLEEVRKAKLEPCQFCHEPTRDRRGFEPPSFDRHCARCHLPDGSIGATEAIPAGAVALPQQIDAPWARARGKAEPDRRGRVIVEKLAHKDPWVLFNLWRISAELDPQGFARKREEVGRRIADLFAQLQQMPSSRTLASLREEEQTLSGRLATLSGDPARALERVHAERDLARVRAQIELGPLSLTAPRPRDRAQLEAELRQSRTELTNFQIGTAVKTPLSPAERRERLAAAAALTAPCALCHVYDGPAMAPVKAAIPVLDRANFTHLPHLQQLACESCHTRVAASTKAEDVNLPGVASCRSCHLAGKTRADCAECHNYHPRTEPWPPI